MSLAKSLSLMGLTNVARLCAAMATFAIMGRMLGAERYGQLMYWMSVGSILALLSNFGLSVLLLKEIGQRPDDSVSIFNESLGAKLLVVLAVIIAAVLMLPFIAATGRPLFLLLLAAMVAEGFTEFFNAGFRARARFGVETRIAMLAAWLYPLSVGAAALFTNSLIAIATAYALSRVAITLLTWWRLHVVIGRVRPVGLRKSWQQVKAAASYAVDGTLSGVFGQLDSLVLNHYLGSSAVGINQAGMRIFLAGSGFATVLANVFLPRAAAAHVAQKGAFAAESTRLQLAFLAVGAGFGLVLAVGGKWFAPLIFGKSFEAVMPLMPWFGLLFMVRFAMSAWSLSLTAQGLQWYRAKAGAVHWLVVLAAASYTVPQFGNIGWLMALVSGNFLLLVLYAGRAAHRVASDMRVLALTALLLVAFLPLLTWR